MENRLIKFRVPHFNNDDSFAYFTYWGTLDQVDQPALDGGTFKSPTSSGLRKGWHQQFTGVHDKNGKEICEGDIIIILDYPYEQVTVGFHRGMFVDTQNNLPIALDSEGMPFSNDSFEVIGNIYEHP